MARPKKQLDPEPRRDYGAWSIDYVKPRRRWRVRPPASIDPKRTPHYEKTRGDAELWAQQEQARLVRLSGLLPADITVGDYLWWWIKETAAPKRWSAGTIRLYKAHARRLGPLLDERLRRLTHAQIQGRVNELLLAGPRMYAHPPHRRPLSANSVLGTVRTWRAAFDAGVKRYRVMVENPAVDLLLPEGEREDANAWTREEVETLIANLPGHRHQTVLTVLLGGGFRIGETLAHRWTDLDWRHNRIYTHATGTHGLQEHTKTRRKRWVPLPPYVMTVLKVARSRLTWDAEFISEYAPGKRWGYTAVRRDLRKHCLELGINPYGTHAARHHAASYMQERGMGLAAMAAVLGNSPGTISKRYLHASPQAIGEAASIMADLFPLSDETVSGQES